MGFPNHGSLKAGVKKGEIWADSILMGGSDPMADEIGFIQASGTDVKFSGTHIDLDQNLNIGGSLRQVTHYYPLAHIGSPATAAVILIQGGSGATGAGSTVWLTYPTAFSQTPSITLTPAKIAANQDYTLVTGSITAGSVQIYSLGAASVNYYYTAIGKK